MNLTKLAKICNVSVSTVSKAMSDSPEISLETKKMITDRAIEYGCYEKYFKPKYPKKLIAIICPKFLGVHYGQIITYLESEISSRNDTMSVSISGFSPQRQSELIDYYANFAHADGIIIIDSAGAVKSNLDVPIVVVGIESSNTKNTNFVKADIYNAMEDAFNALADFGHKKIGFIGETLATVEFNFFTQFTSQNKIEINPNHIVISDKRFYDAGYYAMDKMLKSGDMPTAVFAAYSHIAIGILQRLNEEGISVPKDFSLISMDDLSVVPYPSISCINMHLRDLSAVAIDLLYKNINNSFIKTKQVISVTREFEPGETIGQNKNMPVMRRNGD